MIFKKETTAKTPLARLKVRCDCGFPNHLTIRGIGGGLSWERGQRLLNLKADEWVWETSEPFATLEFKVLINDRTYEQGENHLLKKGDNLTHTPQF